MKKRKWPWILEQQWEDLLFMHWPVPYDLLRPIIPKALELETYQGQAWISVVPFYTSKNRPRISISSFGHYAQLNVRTYVRFYDEPGVYFLSIDVAKWIIAKGTSTLLSLPSFHANMQIIRADRKILFSSHRFGTSKAFSVSYSPSPHTYHTKANTLTHWLTERYCLYTRCGNRIVKVPISHLPWLLQDVAWTIETNDYIPQTAMVQSPLVHYSKMKRAYIHPFEVVGKFY